MRTDKDKKVGLSSALFSNTFASGDDRFLSVVFIVVTYIIDLAVVTHLTITLGSSHEN